MVGNLLECWEHTWSKFYSDHTIGHGRLGASQVPSRVRQPSLQELVISATLPITISLGDPAAVGASQR